MKIRTCEKPNLPRWNGRDFTFGTAECSRKFTFGSSTIASRCAVRVCCVTAHFVCSTYMKVSIGENNIRWKWFCIICAWCQSQGILCWQVWILRTLSRPSLPLRTGVILCARRFKWHLSGAEIRTIQDQLTSCQWDSRGRNLLLCVDFSSKGSLWYHLSWEAHLGKHCDFPNSTRSLGILKDTCKADWLQRGHVTLSRWRRWFSADLTPTWK